MGKKIQAHLAQHLSTFLVGFTGILGKTIHQNPILIVFFRTFFAAIGMFPFFLSKKKTVTLTFKNHFLFFCLGVVFVLHWFTFFTGVQKATASLGTLAFSTFPFFLTFLEPLFYKLPFSFYKILLCIFIMIGVYFLIPQFSLTSSHFVGICWGILSGFFMALAILWSRFLSLKFPIVVISFFQSFYCALLSLPFLFLLLPLQISLTEWIALLALGFFCTALAHSLSFFALKSISAQIFGIILSLEAVYAVFFSYIFFGEKLSGRSILGAIIIILSFAAFQLKKSPLKTKQTDILDSSLK